MRRFSAEELARFLAAVDSYLSTREEIKVLGGAAFALEYDDAYRTYDIDTWNSLSPALVEASEQARKATGLEVILENSTVSQVPYEAEDRLMQVLPELKHLVVLVFDKYDLVLSKAIRGYQKDFDAIRSLHARDPVDEDVLVNRYLKEMNEVIGDRRVIDQNFLNLIDHLYGEVEAERVNELLPSRNLPRPTRSR